MLRLTSESKQVGKDGHAKVRQATLTSKTSLLSKPNLLHARALPGALGPRHTMTYKCMHTSQVGASRCLTIFKFSLIMAWYYKATRWRGLAVRVGTMQAGEAENHRDVLKKSALAHTARRSTVDPYLNGLKLFEHGCSRSSWIWIERQDI